jgi:uncharacterized protein
MLRLLAAALWCLLATLASAAEELVAVPALSARVTDLTGTLAVERIRTLEEALAGIERQKGAQVVIVMLSTTRPETIEQFGIRLAEQWKIGRAGINDGAIVIVAKDDRKMRIEVGYGLEGAVPDAVAKRIVAETMAPHFRNGDFAGGLDAAVTVLAGSIGGEALPEPVRAAEGEDDGGVGYWLLGTILFSGILNTLFGLLGSMLAAAGAGLLAWWIFGSWIAAAIAALLAFVISFLRGGGGVSSGGFSSTDSGGGFSGGGGDFGGGGASGDW